MVDVPTSAASAGDPKKERRDVRLEIVGGISVSMSMITVLGTALGFSPLAKIWTAVPLLIAFTFAAIWFWADHTQKKMWEVVTQARGLNTGKLPGKPSLPNRLLGRTAVILAIFGAGAWVGSSARSSYLLLTYGTLGDLAISPASDMTPPATITIAKINNRLCFSSSAAFYVENATGQDVSLGAVSSSFSMSDGNGSPIFINNHSPDLARTGAGIDGLMLVVGEPPNWEADLRKAKTSLTTFRRGQQEKITIYQRPYGTGDASCLADLNGKLAEAYKENTTLTISGTIVMMLPDGTLKPETVGVTEQAKVIKSF